MKIHTIRIRNFRCFGSDAVHDEWGIVFQPQAGLNLLVGPNGCGKTALVDAIDIAFNPEGHTNRQKFPVLSRFLSLDGRRGTARPISLEISWQQSEGWEDGRFSRWCMRAIARALFALCGGEARGITIGRFPIGRGQTSIHSVPSLPRQQERHHEVSHVGSGTSLARSSRMTS